MILHIDIFVNDMEKMLFFYTKLLGMTLEEYSSISGNIVQYISTGTHKEYKVAILKDSNAGSRIELLEYTDKKIGEETEIYDPVNITFLVPSISQKIDDLAKKELYPDSEIFQVHLPVFGGAKVVFYRDPEGNRLEFLQIDNKK